MPVKIRLQRHGRKQAPFYHIVIADSRSPRDGRFIERIGSYNPMTKPATIEIDRDKAFQWLNNGAQPTDTVRAILRFKGVLFRKHLQRGVVKGAMTQEVADVKYTEWIESKESKIADRVAKTEAEKKAFHKAVFGAPKVVEAKIIPPVVVEEAPAAVEETPAVVEETPVAEAPVVEETPATPEASAEETTTPEA